MKGIVSLLPLILLFVAMYFILFRPQQKRMAEHQKLVRSIDVGDEVVTSAGIFGRITRLTDERAELEMLGGTRIEMLRSSIVKCVDEDDEPAALESGEKKKSLKGGAESGDADDGADEDDSLE